MIRPMLWALALPFCASSCNAVRAFEFAAEVHDGHDGRGEDDLIFLELRNVKGVESGAYALQVPTDWATRDVRTDGQGRLVTAPPCELVLLPGDESTPDIELAESGGEGPPEYYIRSAGAVPLLVFEREGVFDTERVKAETRTRLEVGANAYAVVRSNAPTEGLVADVFGARRAPGDADAHEWVWLGEISYEDQRGVMGKTGDVVLRQTPNAILGVAGTVYLAAVFTSPIWIWFVV